MGLKRISSIWDPCQDGYRQEFIADTDADLADLDKLPNSPCTGSSAVSLASGKVMVVNTEGKWVTFGEPSGSTGGDSIVGTWVLNDELTYGSGYNECKFKVGETEYMAMNFTTTGPGVKALTYIATNGRSIDAYIYEEKYGFTMGWMSDEYKTIEILEEPTSETFITWFKENATKVG